MQYGQRIYTDKRFESFLADGAVNEVVRVGTVQDDKLDTASGTGFHHVVHGADVGIETGSDILNVEYDHVQTSQLLGCRLFVLSV